MNCKEVYTHICEHLDEELLSPRCRSIKKHIETCSGCREYLQSLKSTVRLYTMLKPPPVSASARRKLSKVIDQLHTVDPKK